MVIRVCGSESRALVGLKVWFIVLDSLVCVVVRSSDEDDSWLSSGELIWDLEWRRLVVENGFRVRGFRCLTFELSVHLVVECQHVCR